MQPNLKLVANINLESMHSGQNTAPKQVQPVARHLLMHALTVISADTSQTPLRTKHKKSAYMLLAAVAGIHLAGIAWLLSAAGTVAALSPSKTELNTISVSLLSAPVAKPIVAPVVQPKTKPVTKPVVKNKPVKTEVAKTEVAKTELVTTKEIVTTKVDASVVAVSAASADLAPAAPAEVLPAATTLTEPSIEPPRFSAAYLHNPAPEYPQLSRRMGEQGRVLLRVLVSSNGVADQVQIETSSGSSKLDAAALKAVEKWNFVPAKRSNQPVSAYVLVPVKFSLNS